MSSKSRYCRWRNGSGQQGDEHPFLEVDELQITIEQAMGVDSGCSLHEYLSGENDVQYALTLVVTSVGMNSFLQFGMNYLY